MAASSPGAPRRRNSAPNAAWGIGGDAVPGAAQGTAEVRLRGDEAAALQMNLTLRVWRQRGPREKGRMTTYRVQDVSPDVFVLGDAGRAERAAHGGGRRPDRLRQRLPGGASVAPAYSVYQRHRPRTQRCSSRPTSCTCAASTDKRRDRVEPWRAQPFPILEDLVVDRCAALFLGALTIPLALPPQGRPERDARALAMIDQHDGEGFVGTQIGECTAVCPRPSSST